MGEHPDFIEVHAGRDAADAYATILHELAHVYHGRKHGRAWRLGYLAAVAEVCGVDADEVIADMRGRPSQRKADLVARRWMARQMAQGILYGGSQ
jgi:dTDP-4-dehydrorhamnose reductase